MQILDSPTSPMPSKPIWSTVWRYGLGCGALFILGAQILYHLKIYSLNWPGLIANILVSFFISLVTAYLSIKRQRDQLDGGFISAGKATLVGSISIFWGILILDIWNYLFINFISSSYVDNFKTEMISIWQNKISEKDLEHALAFFDSMKYFSVIVVNSLYSVIPLGILVAITVALIVTRKNRL